MPEFTGLWRNPDFVKLWAGSTVSRFGTLLGALEFTAVVLLDAAPFQMGLLSAAGVAPGILFGFLAGVWVDRARRRPLLVLADLGRAGSLASVPVAYLLGWLSIEQLYVVAFCNGALRTFFDVSFGSYVPALVRRGNLLEANSKLAASESVVETSAFSVGGWIVQLLSSMIAVVIDALTFLVSGLLILSIRTPEALPASSRERQHPWREVWDGIKFVLGHRALRGITGSTAAEGLLFGVVGSVVLIYGVRELGFGTGVLATIFAVGGVSALAGAALTPRVTRRLGAGLTLSAGFLLFGLATLLLPLAQGPLVVAGLFLVTAQLFDAAHTMYSINEVSLRQGVTPDGMLGRVNASLRFVSLGTLLAGSLLGGALAEAIGLRWTLVVGAGCGILGALWLWLSPVRTLREVSLSAREAGPALERADP